MIELLGVLVILVTIILVAIPSITSTMERNKHRTEEQKTKTIASALEVYASTYKSDIGYEEFLTGSCGVKIQTLIDKDLLTLDELKNNNGNYIYNLESYMVKNNDNYENVSNITDCNSISNNNPDNEGNTNETPIACFEAEGNVLTGYNCSDPDVVIPTEVNGVTIEEIKDELFMGAQLNSVTIPDTLKVIGAHSFEHSGLTKVIGGNGLKNIKEYAFYDNFLEEINISSTVETIGEKAFYENNIEKIYLDLHIMQIGPVAFGNNDELEYIYQTSGHGNIETTSSFDWAWYLYGGQDLATPNDMLEYCIVRTNDQPYAEYISLTSGNGCVDKGVIYFGRD